MGEVVLAHDDRLDRMVAIKRLRDDVATPERRERFRREARIRPPAQRSAGRAVAGTPPPSELWSSVPWESARWCAAGPARCR